MKILYILNEFPKLHHTFILNDIIRLIDMGNEVFILSINKTHQKVINKDAFKLKDKTFYLDDFMVENNRYFQKFFIKVKLKLMRYHLFCWIIETFLFGNEIKVRYFKDFGWKIFAFKGIADKIKREKIDIIHGGFCSQETAAAMILSDLTGIHFSFETHAKDLFVYFRYANEKIKKADKIFTISNYNKRYLVNDLKCPESKVIVKRVPFNKSYCDQISEKQKKDNLILSVCRLHPIKGLDYAIEAFKQISHKNKSLKFVVIGDGPLKNQLLEKVERLSLVDKITFLGDVANEVALDYIAQSTIVLLPSVIAPNGDRDGIPTALIEAMYVKTPVISSRVSGIPELVCDGVNGFLTEPGNVKQIAEKMNKLLSNKSLRIEMGERAREKVKKEFNLENSTIKLIDTWQEMLQV